MKKIISAVMTLAMLLSIVAMAIPASASVEVDQNADYIDYVEAYYFSTAPKIDGVITTDEWGEPTVEVDSVNAATKDSKDPNNLFFYAIGNGGADTALSYKMWYRWNEQYFFIGVQVQDPDGHSNQMGRDDIWNGDAFQIRIDPEGPNAAAEGDTWSEGYTADNKPWSADACDLVFGYSNLGGGFTEAFDSKAKTSLLKANGDIPASLVAIVPAGSSYSSDSAAGITTYEIAIPWKNIEVDSKYSANKTYTQYDTSRKNQNYDGGIGREFGISALVYNSNTDITKPVGSHYWNCYLSWGSGVDVFQAGNGSDYAGVAPSTIAGSNSVVLSDTTVNSTPTNYTEGGIPDAERLPFNVPGVSGLVVYQDYLTFDSEEDLDVFGGTAGGERVQDTDGNWVVKWDRWTNPDTGVEELQPNNYLVTETGSGVAGLNNYVFGETWEYPNSYTFEFKIKVTGTETFQDGYDSALYDWFGGPSMVAYQCGYNFNTGKFFVQEYSSSGDGEVLAEVSKDFSLNQWHDWRFQYDNDSCTMRFYFDGELLFSLFNKYFDYSVIHENVSMIFRRMNVQCMMDDIRITNCVNYDPDASIDEVDMSGSGSSSTPSSTQVTENAGATVSKDGNTYHVNVPVVAADANATSLYFDAKFDSTKFTYKGVSGIDASAINVEEMGDGYIRVTITDLSVVKALAAGDTLFSIDFEAVSGVDITDDDVAALAEGVTRVRVSPNTGDSMMLIGVVAATVMVIGTAIVVSRKKKAEEVE